MAVERGMKMSAIKHLMDEVAARMEIDDPNDERVKAEVNRLLSITKRRVAVIACHPNGGPLYIDKMGDEDEVFQFLKELETKGFLDYVHSILVMAEQGEDEVGDWIEFEDGSPVRVKSQPPCHATNGTPPLPGLEARLAGLQVEAYGQHHSVWSILQALTDEEIAETFSEILETCLQQGRTLIIPEVDPCKM
jgi:hypothetical protein